MGANLRPQPADETIGDDVSPAGASDRWSADDWKLARRAALPALLALGVGAWAVGGAEWVETGVGAWTEPSNWSTGRVPDSSFGDAPTIDNGGTAQANGSLPPTFGLLSVGVDNAGTLEIFGGASLSSDTFGLFGQNAGSSGVLTITGAGSNLTLFREVRFGSQGNATVRVESGAQLTTNISGSTVDTLIASGASSVADVTVQDTDSIWQVNDDLGIATPPTGSFGSSGGIATLTITNGGVVASAGGRLSDGDTASALVTVTGDGSRWDAGIAGIFVGVGSGDNPATLTVADGGRVQAGDIVINPPDLQAGARRVRIGDGTEPGVLDVPRVFGAGSGGGLVEIDHAAPAYALTSDGTGTGVPVTLEAGLVVNHIGPGTTAPYGANETNGSFNVDDGTVLVNGSFFRGGFFSNPVFTVRSGATLGGSGRVSTLIVHDGGTVSPGESVGTLTTGDLALSPATTLAFELSTAGAVGGSVNDLIEVDGDLTLDGTLIITDAGGFGPGTYRLFNYSRILVDNGLAIGPVPGGLAASIETGVVGEINLVVGKPDISALLLPERITFPNVEAGQAGAPEPLLLTSTGSDPLQVLQVSVVGSGASAFALTSDQCTGASLGMNQSCDLTLEFLPTSVGLRLARVEVATNAADSPHVTPVSGIGVTSTSIFADSFE